MIGQFWAGPSAAAPLAPQESYHLERQILLPETLTGAVHLLFVADGTGRQGETDETNNLQALAITLSAPDLTIAPDAVTAPAQAVLGQAITVTWTVTNPGDRAAVADWEDRVYFSLDPILDPSDLLLGAFSAAAESPLAAGSGYTRDASVTVPAVWNAPAGYLIIKADGNGRQGETDETNNLGIVAVAVTAPDLSAARITGPSAAVSAQAISVSWKVENTGNSPALADWSDALYLSGDPVLDSQDFCLGIFSAADRSPLAPGDFYTSIQTVRLPGIAAGTYYLLLKVDEFNNQGESDEIDNVLAGSAVVVTVPDLTVTDVAAPSAASPNATVHLSWTVGNQSASVAAPGLWADHVYLSADATLNEGTDFFLASIARPGTEILAAGSDYTVEADVILPSVAAGTWYVIVLTDGGRVQGEGSEVNNTGVSAAVTVEIPDLTVVSLQAPAQAAVQETVALTWQVQNAGPGSASGHWWDYVYLSTNATWENDDLFVATFDMADPSPLAAGERYTVTRQITVPRGAEAYAYLIVVADGGNTQGEADETNNAGDGVAIAIQEPPDLRLAAVSAPDAAAVGQNIEVAWTVTNIGDSTAWADWYDRVYLCDAQTLDGSEILLVGERVSAQTPLAPDASYSGSRQVRLPAAGVGTKYLIFVVNGDGAQGETDASNNTVVRSLEISDPDLTVSASALPATGSWGEQVTVAWTVANQGTGAAAATWYDRLYLSADETLDDTDTLVVSLNQGAHAPMAAGAQYSVSREVTLPSALTGAGYFILVTDATGAQSESNEANNRVIVPVTFNAANLTVSAAAPASAAWAERIAIDWTVTNAGTGPATAAWWDMVFLSTDQTYDANDTLLASAYRTAGSPLASGGSYTVGKSSSAVSAIPAASIGTGTRYLLFRTDVYDHQRETDDADNTHRRGGGDRLAGSFRHRHGSRRRFRRDESGDQLDRHQRRAGQGHHRMA